MAWCLRLLWYPGLLSQFFFCAFRLSLATKVYCYLWFHLEQTLHIYNELPFVLTFYILIDICSIQASPTSRSCFQPHILALSQRRKTQGPWIDGGISLQETLELGGKHGYHERRI